MYPLLSLQAPFLVPNEKRNTGPRRGPDYTGKMGAAQELREGP